MFINNWKWQEKFIHSFKMKKESLIKCKAAHMLLVFFFFCFAPIT